MPNTTRESQYNPELNPKDVLLMLGQHLRRETQLYIPQYVAREIIISPIDRNVDTTTSEGAGFNIDTESIYLKIEMHPPHTYDTTTYPSLWISDQTKNMKFGTPMWSISMDELVNDMENTHGAMPPYMNELVARTLHETGHGLTSIALWNMDDTIQKRCRNMLTTASANSREGSMLFRFIAKTIVEFKNEVEIHKFYQRSFNMRLNVLRHALPLLPREYRKDYLKTGVLFGIGEIISTFLENKIRKFSIPLVKHYASDYYSVYSLKYIQPTPRQHEWITRELKNMSLPLDKKSLEVIRSLADESIFDEYIQETDLAEYL
jgi:hypothetical protein